MHSKKKKKGFHCLYNTKKKKGIIIGFVLD